MLLRTYRAVDMEPEQWRHTCSTLSMPTSASAPFGHNALPMAATYGLAPLLPAMPTAEAFMRFLLGEGGPAVLRSYGFGAP
jgi:ABC-type molybdate transport system substrate-binding protein